MKMSFNITKELRFQLYKYLQKINIEKTDKSEEITFNDVINSALTKFIRGGNNEKF